MISLPTTAAAAAAALGGGGAARAGGTDLQERIALGISPASVVDLRDVAGLDGISFAGERLRVGARVRIAELAGSADVLRGYPGLAEAAAGLATPQVRNVATVGGNLLQRVRCWYFRNPDVHCLKDGGDACRARDGDHLYHACVDLGPCVAPHPSTLGMALLAHDARVTVVGAGSDGESERSVAELLGDGSDPTRENTLAPGELLTSVLLPAPVSGERAAYARAIHRARAEWPLVEAIARLVVSGGRVEAVAVAVGGVATIPLRRTRVEEALLGRRPEAGTLLQAAALAADGARPLPMTGYKVALLSATVLEVLERAAGLAGEQLP